MKAPQQAYDIIGDIHGHADELHALLAKLGYQLGDRSYKHPDGRKVIFLGDFVDRGPQIREALETVRAMVEGGEALTILGNHEVNAMRYYTVGSNGEFLRPHSAKNAAQHQATLDQFPDREEWATWIEWFAGLPLSLDLGDLRVVHACWNANTINEMNKIGRLEGAVLESHSIKGTHEHDMISRLINGPEARLPEGFTHTTADGSARKEIRIKWWKPLAGATCREAIFPDDPTVPDAPALDIPETGYPSDAPPTFFGHYALKEKTPSPVAANLACLDYGIGKGGFLCAYRWDGEESILPEKFVTAGTR